MKNQSKPTSALENVIAQSDSLSSVASDTMQTPAPAKAVEKKRGSSAKTTNKDILVELVTELKNKKGNNSISFGLTKSPEMKQMKKYKLYDWKSSYSCKA
jgi:hypothetical protein